MENKTEDVLLKSRSASSSIAAGYRLYTRHFKKIFHASWMYALLYAITFGATGTIGVIYLPRVLLQMLNAGSPAYSAILQYVGISSVFMFFTFWGSFFQLLFYSNGISLLKQHQSTSTIQPPTKIFSCNWSTVWRLFKAILSMLVIMAIPFILFIVLYIFKLNESLLQPSAHVFTLSLTALIFLFIILIMMPITYIVAKYILCKETHFWLLLAKEYGIALRHFGFVFAVILVISLVVVIAEFIILQPAFVLIIANFQANIGYTNGDPLGMPSYITLLTAGIFAIAGFCQAYIRMSALFPLYYMYGSIETQEQERKDYKNIETT
jgi:hypothetical protein